MKIVNTFMVSSHTDKYVSNDRETWQSLSSVLDITRCGINEHALVREMCPRPFPTVHVFSRRVPGSSRPVRRCSRCVLVASAATRGTRGVAMPFRRWRSCCLAIVFPYSFVHGETLHAVAVR